MTKKLGAGVLLMLLLILSSCIANVPGFKVDAVQTRVSGSGSFLGSRFTFRALTANADAYHWDFGDGSTGTGQIVTHLYTSEGTYTVKLEVLESSLTLHSSADIRVEFVLVQPHTIEIAGTGSGTVSGTGGLDCTITSGTASGTCIKQFDNNTSISLTATPATNFAFDSWTNCSSPSGSSCHHKVTSDLTITANFVRTYTLEVNTLDGTSVVSDVGGIDCPGTCSATFPSGAVVHLTMDTGGNSPYWQGILGPPTDLPCVGTSATNDSTDNPLTVTMDRDRGCEASVIY